jgi:succinate dehydrogenase hydrophobic anchor subunit
MTDEFTVVAMPLKEMIDYAKLGANHSNPQVRIAAMALFAMMYKHAGEAVRNFLKDIKESTMKLIEEEFSKITPLKKGEI